MMRCNCLQSCLQMAREATSFIYDLLPSSEEFITDEKARRRCRLWLAPLTQFFYEAGSGREEHINLAKEKSGQSNSGLRNPSDKKVSLKSKGQLGQNDKYNDDHRTFSEIVPTTAPCKNSTPPPPPSPALSQVMDYSDFMAPPTSPLLVLHGVANSSKENEQQTQESKPSSDKTRSPLVELNDCPSTDQGCGMQWRLTTECSVQCSSHLGVTDVVAHSLNVVDVNLSSSSQRTIDSVGNNQGQESAVSNINTQFGTVQTSAKDEVLFPPSHSELVSLKNPLTANCLDIDSLVLPPSEHSIALNKEYVLQNSAANDLSMVPSTNNDSSGPMILEMRRNTSEHLARNPDISSAKDISSPLSLIDATAQLTSGVNVNLNLAPVNISAPSTSTSVDFNNEGCAYISLSGYHHNQQYSSTQMQSLSQHSSNFARHQLQPLPIHQDVPVYQNRVPEGVGISMGMVTGAWVPSTSGNPPCFFTDNQAYPSQHCQMSVQHVISNTAGVEGNSF